MDSLHALDNGVRGLNLTQHTKRHECFWYGLLILSFAFYFLSGLFELFPRVGWVDAGMYMGYSNNMRELVREYGFSPHNYQGSRLGYLLPCQILSGIFGPIWGRYLFVILLFYSTLTAFWLVANKYLYENGRKILFIGFIVCNPIYLSAIAFGGADGPAMAYVVIGGVCLFCSDCDKPLNILWLSFSGVFAALAVSSHLFSLIPLAIIFSAFYILQMNYWRSIIPLALAFIIIIFGLDKIGLTLGFDRNYLEYSYAWAYSSVTIGSGETYRKPFLVWMKSASIWIPVVFLLLFSISIKFKEKSNLSKYFFAGMLLIFLPVLFVIMYDGILGGSIGQYFSYYVIIILPCFSFSLLFFLKGDVFDRVTLRALHVVLLFICCLFLAAFNVGTAYAAIIICFVYIIGEFIDYYKKPRVFGDNSLLTSLCVAVFVFCEFCFVYNQGIAAVYSKASKGNTKELIEAEAQFISAIKSIPETRVSLGFVYDSSKGKYPEIGRYYSIYYGKMERVFTYFDSLTSLYLWDRTIISWNLNNNEFENSLSSVDKRKTIVALTDSMTGINEINARLMNVSSRYKSIYVTCYQSEVYPWCMQAYRYE